MFDLKNYLLTLVLFHFSIDTFTLIALVKLKKKFSILETNVLFKRKLSEH